ncbi:Hypothetical predicted protein [Pelobates cultripes]|uniref:Uncharacterized protein n=1 Tax=Pelobates cultripes TaxID=61616 RepID=A0AAD1SZR4_PELCU|nr:Hypothetical predicted protein [Pelobates cultripes]
MKAGQTKPSPFQERMNIIQEVKEEKKRRGGFVQIFPHKDRWKKYGCLLTYKAFNIMLACDLFTEKLSEPESTSGVLGQNLALYERKLPPLQTTKLVDEEKALKPVSPSDCRKDCAQKSSLKSKADLLQKRMKHFFSLSKYNLG